jgi:competence protein ComEA
MLKKILALLVMLYATLAMAAVDVNKGTDAELDGIKGIGPSTSKAIVTERKKGDFKDWADLIARVKGIGAKKAEALSKEGLTVNGEAYKPAAAAKKDDKKASAAPEKDSKTAAKETKADSKAAAASSAKADGAKPAASAKK